MGDSVSWTTVAFGVGFVALGVVLISLRTRIALANKRLLERRGGPLGRREARRSTGAQFAIVGALPIAVGVILLVGEIVSR